ncbi:UDP-N-acetylenolpyruvoylglucosamine reductase [uncultured Eubacteriales bacterium]|uniref:UDP-N-acetylenolpyruvoylglucosamine reductase n=1 Tax=uncultured Eubacteriales bacterium TaxID=172733 RepID=A0A212JKY2_9FIRM|nr:UDP-N-acetylenolpyruvoylglucosamine reductase [uncultured Eubacteriales bacterium]
MEIYSTLTQELRAACPGLEVREYEPMKNHTTFRVGGPARLMALPRSEEEAVAAVRIAAGLGLESVFMGNGSNLLVSDAGVDAFIVKAHDGLGEITRTGEWELTAGSGVLLSRLANFACDLGLTGLEFAHGIPGTVGGAVTMNAGAYGGEMCEAVEQTRYLTGSGEIASLQGEEHDFSYRHSAFSDGKRLILSSTFRLAPGDSAAIRARIDELMERRRSKQPLEMPSAGSTFKRPEGHFAAALIEQCGLKGTRVGGAQVSEKHAGFVINREDATCADILALVALVRETVLRETGVVLEMEVRTLGPMPR